jgi:hypothetical protein
MMGICGRRMRRAFLVGIVWVAGGTFSAISQDAPVQGESIPGEPFVKIVPAESASEPPADSGEAISDDNLIEEPVISSAADRPANQPFSLWDFFSSFFELGSPGDPNHPDKLRTTIGTSIGYDDNVFTTNTDRIASGTAGLNGTIAYNFGSERLKILSALALGVTYYDNRPGDDTDYNGSFTLGASYFITRRLQVSGNATFAYLSQPNPTLIGGASKFSGDYTTTNLGFGLNYTIRPRLSIRLQYQLNSVQYTEELINQQQGFTEQNYILGLDYLLTPRFTLTAEYRYNPLSYEAPDQDSQGQVFTLGFTANFSPKLKWTLQAGAEMRMLNNTNSADAPSQYTGPFLETDVTYDFTPSSSFVARMRYGTEPSGSAGISIRETLRGSLGLHYAFSGRLSTDVGISYQHDRYDQPGDINDFTQEYCTASVSLRYQFNPAFAVTAGYNYSAVQSEDEVNDYTRGITTLGLEIIF